MCLQRDDNACGAPVHASRRDAAPLSSLRAPQPACATPANIASAAAATDGYRRCVYSIPRFVTASSRLARHSPARRSSTLLANWRAWAWTSLRPDSPLPHLMTLRLCGAPFAFSVCRLALSTPRDAARLLLTQKPSAAAIALLPQRHRHGGGQRCAG